MKNNHRSKLREFFAQMACDLEIGLATALAEKFHTSPAVIFTEFEAWQITE